jgi:hypothetical protein
MKTALTFLFFICFSMASTFGQSVIDVVRLNNGEVYRGQIIKKDIDGTIELKVGRNNIMVFAPDEIKKLDTETIAVPSDSLSNYGGKIGLGFAVGGGGLVGFPLRIKLGEKSSFEVGPFFRPFIEFYEKSIEIHGGLMVAGAINFNMSKHYNVYKEKIIRNGLFIRYGRSFGKYDESLVAFGWAGERFKKARQKMSFVHELGPGIIVRHWFDGSFLVDFPKNKIGVGLIWKVHANNYMD